MTSNSSNPVDSEPSGISSADPTHVPKIEVMDLTPQDEFYYAWGRESLKNNLTFANEVLRELVALMSLLLGGSVAFLGENIMAPGFKVLILISFFSALVLAFLGMMPYEGKVQLDIPAAIKEHKERAFASKRRFLWGSGALLGIGFGTSVAGIAIKLF